MSSAPSPVARRAPAPWWRRAMPLLGLALVVWVLARVDTAAVGHALTGASLGAVSLCAFLFSVNVGLKVVRWHRMLVAQGRALPLAVTTGAFLESLFYGQITIGRVGELYRAEALTERGVPLGEALSSSLFDRVLDVMLVTLVAGLLGAVVVGRPDVVPWAFGLFVLVGAGVWALAGRSAGDAVTPADPGAVPGLVARVFRVVVDLRRGMRSLVRPRPIADMLLWTLVAWFFYFWALVALARGLSIDASARLLVASGALAALSALLPVTMSGLGAREIIFIAALGLEHIPAERAVALSLLHLAVMTACALLLGVWGMSSRRKQRARGLDAGAGGVERPEAS